MKTLLKHTPKKTTLPILKSIMVKDDRATISDCNFWLSCPVIGKPDGLYNSVAFDAPLAKLLDTSITDFPIISEMPEVTATYKFDAANLLQVLELAAQGMGKEASRYYLCGILFNGVKMVATNGHVLHELDAPCEHNPCEGVIIPDYAIKILVDLLKERKSADNVVMGIHNREEYSPLLRFIIAGYTLTCRAIDGNYPDYKRIMPEPDKLTFAVQWNKAEFKTILPQLKLLSKQNSDNFRCVKLSESNVEYMGNKFPLSGIFFSKPIYFNYNYLAQLPDCDLYYNHDDVTMATLVRHALGLSVVMPMRGNVAYKE
ncbi:MAG: hypothetical protein KGJ90_05005 [Patescibacteria group bacterium]|nr:hypothetical protein [Patescibacteria group bacterium]